MSAEIQSIVDRFPELLTLVRGDGHHSVNEIQTASLAKPESLVFVGNAEHLKEALTCSAAAWVVSQAVEGSVPPTIPVVLRSPNVQLAMALVAKAFFPQARNRQMMGESIHPRAVISPSAKVGARCIIGPGAVLGDDVEVGEDCVIGSNSVLEPGVKIGPRTQIHPLVFIGHSCEIGSDCEIKSNTSIGGEGFGYAQDQAFNHHRITHYGKVILENDVHVGSGVQIDRGTFVDSRIGEGTKIDNHCHFGHNIVIGKKTLVTGGMITAGSATIGSFCVFGGRTTVKGHIHVTDRVQVGGLSAITKSVTKPGEYGGFPLQEIGSEMRTRATIKQLPELAKQVRRILKHLGLEAKGDAK
jgi:UDP-3-O-[3-hydroxymyristoyl] glucosamine N-acyltransferase